MVSVVRGWDRRPCQRNCTLQKRYCVYRGMTGSRGPHQIRRSPWGRRGGWLQSRMIPLIVIDGLSNGSINVSISTSNVSYTIINKVSLFEEVWNIMNRKLMCPCNTCTMDRSSVYWICTRGQFYVEGIHRTARESIHSKISMVQVACTMHNNNYN